MLRLVLGENRREKLGFCAENIRETLRSGGRVLAVVPDQFSFDYDKSLYSELGAKDFNAITVLSFRRLSETLLGGFGAQSGTLCGPGERMILISLALKRVRSRGGLKLLSKAVEKPGFCEEFSHIADAFRRSGVTPDGIRAAEERVGGTLKDKLSDIADVYEAYTAILKERSLRDESSIITEGGEVADIKKAFSGLDVYIDRFDSFSPDELKMLRLFVRDARRVTVCLYMPKNYRRSAVSPFAQCEGTQNSLVSLASEFNKRLEYIWRDSPRTGDPALAGAGRCLFEKTESVPRTDSITMVRADDLYAEADFVAAAIRRLVTEDGYGFNDVAVITHDLDSYAPVLEASFERYGVTAFIDSPRPASSTSLVLFVLDALEAAATRRPDTDRIIKYLRSPFSPLSFEETSLLWDYTVKWNVDGEMWLSDFTAGEPEELEKINAARKKAVGPLEKLRGLPRPSSAKEIASAFCEFLKETDLAGRASGVINDCDDEGLRLETARLFKQLWNAVMTAISEIYLIAGDEKFTLRGFGDLLRLVLSQTAVASPPQKLSSVTVADVERSIISEPKAAFIVGLSDGLFPMDIRRTVLFSGRDIAELESVGLSFEITPQARLSAERFDCCKAFSAPTEKLYLSRSTRDLRGRELRPSRFLGRISSFCGAAEMPASSMGAKFYCSAPAAAYYSYAVSRNLTDAEKAAVSEALAGVEGYPEKLSRLGEEGGSHSLSREISRRLFAAKDINITASRIDVYNKCPYEYFCKFGLRLEPIRPVEINPANRGTVMHYIFENTLRHYGEAFSEATDDELREYVSKLLDEFSSEKLGGDFGKSSKFRADYLRLGEAALEILANMREEFRVSKFRPAAFEYDLSDDDGRSALSIPLADGIKLNIRGIVDRVDTYSAPDGRRYIRVTDYKTGGKEFAFEDIYNGLNLQLLLYMLALTEGRDPKFSDCTPSGILYMRAGFLECKDGYDPLSEDKKTRLRRVAEQLKRKGVVVDLKEPLEAMDSAYSGVFAPVTLNRDGSYSKNSKMLSEKSFALLENFAKKRAMLFGTDLLNGRIDALPTGTDPEHLQCAYCDYTSVCNRKKYIMKLISKSDADKLAAEIMLKEEAEEDV